jgi:hypothetical protein
MEDLKNVVFLKVQIRHSAAKMQNAKENEPYKPIISDIGTNNITNREKKGSVMLFNMK